ncbi:hypothetical protein MJ1HA_1142 [Metallosphaera sedula]|nr:hypothetical protein MJ1HA_1142 [Metallosphaera sedula]
MVLISISIILSEDRTHMSKIFCKITLIMSF